jgi:membrane protease YdiL (CAAX protease family)
MTEGFAEEPRQGFPPSRQGFDRRDAAFFVTCLAVMAASIFVISRYFWSAFPEASIEFRFDRKTSAPIAEILLRDRHLATTGMMHSAEFDHDDEAKIFLERTIGLEGANAVMRDQVRVWYWRHRWFKPLEEEEYRVDVSPTGAIIAFDHRIPESRQIENVSPQEAREIAEQFLHVSGAVLSDLGLVAQSERALPHRIQRLFTYESRTIRPGNTPYRYLVTVDGSEVSSYSQALHIPDSWRRSYAELRSKNSAAGAVDSAFLALTMIAALAIFVVRARRGDLQMRMLTGIAVVTVILVTGVALNSFPSALAGYDTRTSFSSFVTQQVLFAIVQGVAYGMLLVVIVGAGETLYRQRLPQHLAIPRLWNRRALSSKRVFRSFVLGYTLVAFFLAYQVVFYLVADHFGAWAPAEIPYDEMLNSALPWVAVLFAGFFPALSEEFMSRAFSIPLLERIFRSRVLASVAAGFIWGFGHATYPNQPFYIRGVEVGLAGVLLGFIFYRFGLVPLLIWHYTVDAIYTALLLFRSHNAYYIASAGAASLVFAIPMIVSLFLYFRNGGFVADDDLSNGAIGSAAPPAVSAQAPAIRRPLPPAIAVTRPRVVGMVAAVVVAAILFAFRPATPDDAIDYATGPAAAVDAATRQLRSYGVSTIPERHVAFPAEAFRSWDRGSQREEGGGPDGFDSTSAEYLLRHGLTMQQLIAVFRTRVRAGTWVVRFFTPMQKLEYFIELDSRTLQLLGFHEYHSEDTAGAQLDKAAALDIASRALPAYRIDPKSVQLKEGLVFQQPHRRDWLFHFEDSRPIVARAFRRVSVRVAGDRVSQVAMTVKIPDEDYRAASQQTMLNTILGILRLAGIVTLAALVIAGFVITTRSGRFVWRPAIVWSLLLAVVPIAGAASSFDQLYLSYDTSIQWQTFLVSLTVSLIMKVALQTLLVFLAIAAIDSAIPAASPLLSGDGARRFGRSAAIAAITAMAVAGSVAGLTGLIESYFPQLADVSLSVSSVVAAHALPLVGFLQALQRAIIGSAVVAMLSTTLASPELKRWAAPLTIAALTLTALDSAATPHQLPLMFLGAFLPSAALYFIVRYVLANNLLAYPLALLVSFLFEAGVPMLHNHRGDLQFAGTTLIAAAILILLVFAALSERASPTASREPSA